ncbi:hypothetical protein [Enterococcus faecium]|uniref:hypothetical protein n=1 Tax=Enterococcus faecium TaxID=1352 RepID=UPI000BF1620A|nr:hypothetical protein [Enterococcus faecium]PEH49590.1 hypothetical protein CRM75_01385 [Enterococcus faecium]
MEIKDIRNLTNDEIMIHITKLTDSEGWDDNISTLKEVQKFGKVVLERSAIQQRKLKEQSTGRIQVKVIFSSTGSSKIFKSIRETARFLGITTDSVRKYLDNGKSDWEGRLYQII